MTLFEKSHRKHLLRWALAAVIASASACGRQFPLDDHRDPNDRGRVQLWTLFDILRASDTGTRVAPSPSFPAGFDPAMFLARTDKGPQVVVAPAFSEGEPAGYITTEVWVGFPEIWVQPWYFLVTAYDEKSPQLNRLKEADGKTNTAPIFDVGPDSKFYSPFWQIYYVVVPPGTKPDTYKSAEQLFDDKLTIHPSAGWVYSVRPTNVTGTNMLTHPFLKKEIGVLASSPAAWVDGRSLAYFSLGGSNFRFDDRLVVEAVPLFVIARRDASGTPVPLGAPHVVGSVPLWSRRPAEIVAGRPRFGAYSRLYVAIAPATATAFDPDASPGAVEVLAAKMIDPNVYRGRVASNGRAVAATDKACFDQPEFPMGCTWLDSQTSIENTLGAANIQRTEVTMASALVFFGTKGIGR